MKFKHFMSKILNRIYAKALDELLICKCFNTEGLTEKDIKELLEEINKEE